MVFCDELAAGILPASTPEVQAAFGLRAGLAAGLILVGFQALSLFLEPLLLLWASRGRRHRFLIAGLVAMAACCALGAQSSSWALLLVAVLLYGPASGLGCHLAQASLMDERAGDRERAMARWCLAGSLGDAAAFALLPALAWVGLGWREAMLVCAAAWVLLATRLSSSPVRPSAQTEVQGASPRLHALRDALRNRSLLAWCSAGLLCALLDEILVAFGAIHLSHRLGLGPEARSLVFGAYLVGQIGGTASVERLLATVRPIPLLRVATVLGLVAYVSWVLAPGLASCVVLALLVGTFTSANYPIVEAQAYAQVPGRSGTVVALGAVLAPIELAFPLVVAWVAERFGLTAAMLLLALEPAGIFVIACMVRGSGLQDDTTP